MFAPCAKRPIPSFNKTHLADSIIVANSAQSRFRSGVTFTSSATLMQFLAQAGIGTTYQNPDGTFADNDAIQQCATQ